MSLQGEGNVLLTDDIIMKEALKLLKNNLVMAALVYRDTEPRFNKVGDTISLRLPFRTKTATGRTLVNQPMIDQVIPFTINHHEHFALEINQRDRTLSLENFSDRYLKSGVVQLANVIDRTLLERLRLRTFFGSGTPGTAITHTSMLFTDAFQTNVAVPDDGLRRAVMNPLDAAEISTAIVGIQQQELVKKALLKGEMGNIADYDCFKTGNIGNHKVGDHGGTPVTNGADQTGASLVTDGWDSSVTILNEGDTFTLADVFEVNPQSYVSTGRLQRFVATAAAASDGSGNLTIAISPSINDGTNTTVDTEGNSVSLAAYQNVNAAPADGAAIVVIGVANTTYRNVFHFHRDAIALSMVDLELPQSAVVKARIRDEDSGLSLSMTQAYDIKNHSEITRIDAVWGEAMIYPELAHRFFSDNV